MIIVGYLYNNNGMATWCLETAAALHEDGHDVLLIASSSVSLPFDIPYRTLKFDLPSPAINSKPVNKVQTVSRMFSGKSNGFSVLIYQTLLNKSIQPDCFFLNQSDMLDERVPVPQYVCAWVYPLSKRQYLTNGYLAANKKSLKSIILSVIFSLSFYFKDQRAFKNATKVLALSPAMENDLLQRDKKAILLSPCCKIKADHIDKQDGKIVNLIIAALDLDNPRKNIHWMLEAINSMKPGRISISLIGEPGEKVKQLIADSPHPIIVNGIVTRNEALELFAKADVFLFASIVDDWGYVITEAMANGLAVLVPNKNPYNYIVENNNCLFEPRDKKDFLNKLTALVERKDLVSLKMETRQRAIKFFSREVFAKNAQKLLVKSLGIKSSQD